MRLFHISGLEFLNFDNLEGVHNNDLLFFSFGIINNLILRGGL